MQNIVQKLLDIGSSSLGLTLPREEVSSFPQSRLISELFEMLAKKNGFFAFESALHVFPADRTLATYNLFDWNRAELWKSEYKGLADGLICFAQDIFGVQHCIKGESILTFDPETGATEFLASSIEEWAAKILADYEFLTGYPVAHLWQKQNGPLAQGQRLMPKIPFVCDGAYEVDNLFVLDAVKSMRVRANFAIQIKDIPDGEKFIFKVID